MYAPLVSLYHPAPPPPTNSPLALLALPLHDETVSDLHLTLLSTYLLHTLNVVSHTTTDLAALVTALHDSASPTLLRWAPAFARLPEKQQDHLYTQAYTIISRLASTASPAATAYSLRIFALLCLAQTRPSVIAPNTFWQQAVKFTAMFANTDSISPNEEAKYVCDLFARVLARAEKRPDASDFMAGAAFARFCEYWSRFAKQVREFLRSSIDGMLIRTPRPATCTPSSVSAVSHNPQGGARSLKRTSPPSRLQLSAQRLRAPWRSSTTGQVRWLAC